VRTREKPVREARFETRLTVSAEARATTARCRADETPARAAAKTTNSVADARSHAHGSMAHAARPPGRPRLADLFKDGSQSVYAIAWKDTINRCAHEETSTKGR
jgi:hypothetical protein